mmetsp:Transcript_14259/g.29382  ORF Transcript_14259/g.29382 Transcript_14259/m.29382 type:complete len:928 (+) Transcript_14259:134-2917(+)
MTLRQTTFLRQHRLLLFIGSLRMIATLHFTFANDLLGTETFDSVHESASLVGFNQLKNRVHQNSIIVEGTNQERSEKSQNQILHRSSRSTSEIHELLDSLEEKANEAVVQNGIAILPSSRSDSANSIDKTRIFPYQQSDDVKDSTKGEEFGSGGISPDLRIINGESAPSTRYPYAVSLQYNRQHSCGASLVAPDIVLTAAHCSGMFLKATIGRYDLDDYTDSDFEVLGVTKEIVHPDYDDVAVDNDFCLMVLEKESIHPYVKVNGAANIPVDGDSLSVMGWGDIDPDAIQQVTSDELREAEVTYLTNAECQESVGFVETIEGPVWAGYEGGISDNMMCALDSVGTVSDACQGDSGGPLVRLGSDESGKEDVQVGIVSWGFSCADPSFPGVYARLSSQYYWLKDSICQNSNSPPEYLDCDPNDGPGGVTITEAPTPSPISAEELEGLITIFVQTDPVSPEDLGWELSSVPDGEIIESAPVGYYAGMYQEALMHEVIVDPENFYRLTIYDDKSDGFLGFMTVFRGRSYVTADTLVLEPGFSSISGPSVDHGFYVGDDPPMTLTLDLEFDAFPEELAWSVTNVKDNLPLGFKWFGWYSNALISARETIPIYGSDRGTQQYVFEVLDEKGNGMCCEYGTGSYALYFGAPNNQSRITHGGNFLVDETYKFEVDSSGELVVTSAPTSKPTPAPTPSNSAPTTSPTQESTTLEFYAVPSTGICAVNDQSRPPWINKIYTDYDLCCQESAWNKEKCFALKPILVSSDTTNTTTEKSNQDGGEKIEFTPVTGTFTCRTSGLICTITCNRCGSIEREAADMLMEFPDKNTIIYTATIGTDDSLDSASTLTLIETDDESSNSVSCDEGCKCEIVNEDILGCGFVPQGDSLSNSSESNRTTEPTTQPVTSPVADPSGVPIKASSKVVLLSACLISFVFL